MRLRRVSGPRPHGCRRRRMSAEGCTSWRSRPSAPNVALHRRIWQGGRGGVWTPWDSEAKLRPSTSSRNGRRSVDERRRHPPGRLRRSLPPARRRQEWVGGLPLELFDGSRPSWPPLCPSLWPLAEGVEAGVLDRRRSPLHDRGAGPRCPRAETHRLTFPGFSRPARRAPPAGGCAPTTSLIARAAAASSLPAVAPARGLVWAACTCQRCHPRGRVGTVAPIGTAAAPPPA